MVWQFIIVSSYIKALYAADQASGYSKRLIPLTLVIENPIKVIFLILTKIIFWPYTLFEYLLRVIRGFDEQESRLKWTKHFEINPRKHGKKKKHINRMVKHDFAQYIEGVKFYTWVGFIIFGIILLLVVNQLLQ